MQKSLAYLLVALMFNIGSAMAYDETIVKVFETIENDYIEPMAVPKMSSIALRGLNKIDKSLQVADDNNRSSVYYKAKMLRNFIKPEGQDPKEWAMYIDRIVSFATKVSAEISKRDYEATDVMMAELISKLDVDSKYYKGSDLVDSVDGKQRISYADRVEDNVLYIKIGSFNKETSSLLNKTIEKYPDVEGIILDLRGNSGGLLDQVIDTADVFLDGGIILSAVGRADETDKFYMAEEGSKTEGKPMVVLVDGKTASSAEILSGSLREQGRAKIVGSKTFGKGSIQKLVELPNGSELAITNAHLQLPSGEPIKGQGIVPDYCLTGYDDGFTGKQILANKGADVCDRESRENKKLDLEAAFALIESMQ